MHLRKASRRANAPPRRRSPSSTPPVHSMVRRLSRDRSVSEGEPSDSEDGGDPDVPALVQLIAERWGIAGRKADVARGVLAGQSNAEIAAALQLSRKRVAAIVTRLLAIVGVRSRLALLKAAYAAYVRRLRANPRWTTLRRRRVPAGKGFSTQKFALNRVR
jgi:DNA-binding CsgD family transcriptional regulator